ncbi:MAG: LacI family DNA-binding transcriptional regulator, partial [Oscillospiraceae bacterium]
MTIKDIAKESGYAISTVSRALNNKSDVSAEARMKIQAIVKSHEFVPNNHAKQLKQQQTTSISIIVKGSFNMFFASIVEQLQNYISKSGYSTIIHYLGEIVDEVKMAQRLILENKPLGIIFLGGNVDSFKKEFSGINIPCVLATTYSPDLDFTNLSMVGIDDISAGEKAITYLIKKGHTKIGIIGGDRDVSFISNMRFKGCLKGLIYGGKSFDDSYYQTAKFSYSSAYKAMFALSKAFSIAQASINLWTAVSQAMALPFPANIPFIAQALAY